MTIKLFRLRELVEELHESTGIADPSELAPIVLEKIPRHAYKVACAEMLVDFVRRVVKEPHTEPTNAGANTSAAASAPGESWRRRAARILTQSECLDGATWKQLGDCTADDLRAAAAYKRSRAHLVLAVADRVETAAKEMDRLGVTLVRDLPPDVIVALFGKQAAA